MRRGKMDGMTVSSFGGDQCGSVLMEYLVVNLFIAVPLLELWHVWIFDAGLNQWVGDLGTGIQAMFQRVLAGIALPVP